MPNTCAVTYAIIQRSTGLEGLRLDLIARLAVLRLQSPDLYAAVIRDPDLLAALEMACRGKRQNSLDRAFGSERAAWMMETAEEFRGSRNTWRRYSATQHLARSETTYGVILRC